MNKLPLLFVKDIIAFPFIFTPLLIGREYSKNSVKESLKNLDGNIVVALQKDVDLQDPKKLSDTYPVGVLCKIIKFEESTTTPDAYKILLQGVERVQFKQISTNNNFIECEYLSVPPVEIDVVNNLNNKTVYEALFKDLVYIIEKGFVTDGLIPLKELKNPVASCYLLLSITKDSIENQKLLECNDGRAILKETYDEIIRQKNKIDMKEKILEQTRDSMSKNQKDYYLKEQIRVIKKELGEDNETDLQIYQEKFDEIEKILSEPNKKEILKNIKKLKNATSESYEISVIKNHMDYVFELPWVKESEENLDLKKSKDLLNLKHSYLEDVKERILEFLSVKKLNPTSKAPIICFQGPPGVGKTSFAQTIAESIGRESVRISLGGVKDESEIRGHRRTYVGAAPGKIMHGMRQAGTKNPVFILDEIDKMSSDFRGDPSSALLEVLDPEQNNTFKDHYINLEFDLSKVMFIATANSLDSIPGPLLDRLEVIKIPGYCEEEKIEIAKKFLIPKKVKEGGLDNKDLQFNVPSIQHIIRHHTREFGVRELERQIHKVVRKIAKKKAEKTLKTTTKMTDKNIKDFLGVETYSTVEDNKNGVGIVTGLAWTPYGGEILKLEAILLNEPGDIILTGRLGEVMQESAKIGVSIIKENAKKLGINSDLITKNRVHIHAPAGATPKDGPSAGIALVSSMVSLYTKKKIKNSLAMTGEVTLTGKVWPVGGIREKVLAAIRSGITTVILPKDNKKDFDDIPEQLRKNITVKYVSTVAEVIKEIF